MENELNGQAAAPTFQQPSSTEDPPPSSDLNPSSVVETEPLTTPSNSLQTLTDPMSIDAPPAAPSPSPAPVSFLTNSGIPSTTVAPVDSTVQDSAPSAPIPTDPALQKGAPKPKKRTAYFIFMDETRARAKQNLIDAGQENVQVGDVSKVRYLWKGIEEETFLTNN